MTQIKVESKEIEVVKTQIEKAFTIAQSAVIKSDAGYEEANKNLVKIRTVAKLVDQQKRKQLDPANETVKAIRDFWRPLEDRITEAEGILKKAILTYKAKLDARLEQKEATISKKVEEGTLSFEKGVEKVAAIQATPTTHAGIKSRKIRKVEFAQLVSLMPEEIAFLIRNDFVVWNEVPARQAALNGLSVPGTRVYEEEILA